MNLSNSDFQKLDKDGFILKKNVLQHQEVEKVKNIIKEQHVGKGVKESYYPITFFSLLIKFLKLDFKKIKQSFYLLYLKKKLNLDLVAKEFFKKNVELRMLDGYWNLPQKKDILPWHSDQAHGGIKYVSKLLSPDFFHLKFFFYFTKVGPDNGCTSYLPGSHKITYAVRACLYEKKIKYQPFWELSDLVNFINKKENYKFISEKVQSKALLDEFFEKANLVLSNKEKSYYNFEASPGDLLIFNEGGVHRGSMPSLTERVVLRYLYSKK